MTHREQHISQITIQHTKRDEIQKQHTTNTSSNKVIRRQQLKQENRDFHKNFQSHETQKQENTKQNY